MDEKTIKELSSLREKLDVISEDETLLKDEVFYLTNDLVMAFGTKRSDIVKVLGVSANTENNPTFDFSKGLKSRVSKEYLKDILKFLIRCPDAESVDITVLNDYPIQFEIVGMNSRFVLAPKVESD